jgi:hypothetical protein
MTVEAAPMPLRLLVGTDFTRASKLRSLCHLGTSNNTLNVKVEP